MMSGIKRGLVVGLFGCVLLIFSPLALSGSVDNEGAVSGNSGHSVASASDFFRYQMPDGWYVVPEHPFGLSAEEKKVYAVALHGPRDGEIPERISMAYYAPGNLLYKSEWLYLRTFFPAPLAEHSNIDAEKLVETIIVSGKKARMFDRERKEFLPMHRVIEPNSPAQPDDPRVFEGRRELMARGVPVRERFVVVPARFGFYALRYSADAQGFDELLPDFMKLIATFEVLE